MPGIYVKIHKIGGEILLAACDEELLGRSFSEGMLRLDVNEAFYGGFQAELDDLVDYLREATIANLVGERVVGKAVEEGYVHPDAVLEISGVPHAQVVSIRW